MREAWVGNLDSSRNQKAVGVRVARGLYRQLRYDLLDCITGEFVPGINPMELSMQGYIPEFSLTPRNVSTDGGWQFD